MSYRQLRGKATALEITGKTGSAIGKLNG